MKLGITTHPATASAGWQIQLDESCEHELSIMDVLGEVLFFLLLLLLCFY
jgi:hypothetical protein